MSCYGEYRDPCGNPKIWFEGRLLQCRHCPLKNQCIKNPDSANHRKGHGRVVTFILADKRSPNYTDWMKHRIDSREGKQIYSHRMLVAEPVFGNITTNKKLNRFSLRGKRKVQGQWQLTCMVHSIEKIMNYGHCRHNGVNVRLLNITVSAVWYCYTNSINLF